jgi:HK97 family phage major capsid protein
MTLFEYNEKIADLNAQIASDADWIALKAADASTSLADLQAKERHRDDVAYRRGMLVKQRDEVEAKQKAAIAEQRARAAMSDGAEDNPKKKIAAARGEFYRGVLLGSPVTNAYAELGGIPAGSADLGYGDRLLPTSLSNELIVEPALENPMRAIVRVSNITGLEEPKLLFDLNDGYDDVTDAGTAKEIQLTGDTVTYSRHKVKVRAKVSDTVLHGSPLALASEIDSALRSGLSQNEMNRMFASSPDTGYELMSFYSASNAVPVVNAPTKQAAIAAALADLPLVSGAARKSS